MTPDQRSHFIARRAAADAAETAALASHAATVARGIAWADPGTSPGADRLALAADDQHPRTAP